jgi:hypothetical protein
MKQGMECPNFLSKENQTFHKNWGHSIAPWLHWGPGSGWGRIAQAFHFEPAQNGSGCSHVHWEKPRFLETFGDLGNRNYRNYRNRFYFWKYI